LAEAAAAAAPPRIHIRAGGFSPAFVPREIWNHHELLAFLIWRDIKLRYRQTVLGAAWAILQPALMMLVFSIFFGRLAGVPSDGVPYPLFVYTALVPWMVFASGVTQAANSLVGNQALITKVYFPRILIPAATMLSGIVDLIVSSMVLVAMMAYYGVVPGVRAVAWPAFAVLTLLPGLGAGLWLSALNVRFRDVRYVVPFLVQFWMLATPVAYPMSLLSPQWQWLYAVNPLVGIVEGFRWLLLGTTGSIVPAVMTSLAVSAALTASGVLYFRKVERSFADVL
jgi:lipopolysaccharide transport system permease protein